MPGEVQDYTVPHLKALISGKMEPRGLRWGSTFRVCQALLNTAILLHKEAYRADLFASHCSSQFRVLYRVPFLVPYKCIDSHLVIWTDPNIQNNFCWVIQFLDGLYRISA